MKPEEDGETVQTTPLDRGWEWGCGIDDPSLNRTSVLIKLRELLRTPKKLSKFCIQKRRPFPRPLEESSYMSLQRHQSSFLYGKGCGCG